MSYPTHDLTVKYDRTVYSNFTLFVCAERKCIRSEITLGSVEPRIITEQFAMVKALLANMSVEISHFTWDCKTLSAALSVEVERIIRDVFFEDSTMQDPHPSALPMPNFTSAIDPAILSRVAECIRAGSHPNLKPTTPKEIRRLHNYINTATGRTLTAQQIDIVAKWLRDNITPVGALTRT